MIVGVVAHEVSHFWFGDLVSPTDWKDIWLNESFASYFTFAIPDHYFPDWHAWEFFVYRYHMVALGRDSLIETFPVELPGGEEDFINPAKASIVYNKGACILRMLQGYLGEELFKKGINHFLKKFEFSCATTKQYWTEFEEATEEPIEKFAKSWINQPGYPIVNVKRNNNELTLTQELFTYFPHDSNLSWFIPINIIIFLNNGETRVIKTIMEEKTKIITIPAETKVFKLNYEQTGFYRVKYEKAVSTDLGQLISTKQLSPLDRYGVENDLYALVKRGDYSISDYLEYLRKYILSEDVYLPLMSILSNLMHAYSIINAKRKEISEVGVKLIAAFTDKNGFEPKESDEFHLALIRESILWIGFSLGYQPAIEIGKKCFQDLLSGKDVHPDILSSVLKIGAASNDEATNYFLRKVLAPETPEVEKLYILQALGCFKEKKKILDALRLTLKQVPAQSRSYVYDGLGQNPDAIEYLWSWFQKNQKKLEKESHHNYARAIASLIPRGGLGKEAEVKQFFEEHLKKTDLAKDTIKMVLEQLEVNSRLRNT